MKKLSFLFLSLVIFDIEGGIPLAGDFNGDNIINLSDIDMLYAEYLANTNNLSFDLNADGIVGINDLDIWLSIAAAVHLPCQSAYRQGDINLDGVVNKVDSTIIATNTQTMFPTWSKGDLNYDGHITNLDLLHWSNNKGSVSCDMSNCMEINLSIRNEHFENLLVPSTVSVSGNISITGEIRQGTVYTFSAKDSIVLMPFFEVILGGEFSASTGPQHCN